MSRSMWRYRPAPNDTPALEERLRALAAVRLVECHAACELLDLPAFNEETLYANLDWLSEQQSTIEDRLLRWAHP
jgi:hypothetical protein